MAINGRFHSTNEDEYITQYCSNRLVNFFKTSSLPTHSDPFPSVLPSCLVSTPPRNPGLKEEMCFKTPFKILRLVKGRLVELLRDSTLLVLLVPAAAGQTQLNSARLWNELQIVRPTFIHLFISPLNGSRILKNKQTRNGLRSTDSITNLLRVK